MQSETYMLQELEILVIEATIERLVIPKYHPMLGPQSIFLSRLSKTPVNRLQGAFCLQSIIPLREAKSFLHKLGT